MTAAQWWGKIFKNSTKQTENKTNTSWINYSGSTLLPFGDDPYRADIVNNAIERRATEVSKLVVRSVVEKESGTSVVKDEITRLFRERPNPKQTTSDFLACVEWIRLKRGNAFIYPEYYWVNGVKHFDAFWVLDVIGCAAAMDERGELFYTLTVREGTQYTVPASEIIHMKWRRGTNLDFGGDDNGNVEVEDLVQSVTSINQINQGLPKAIEASLQTNGIFSAKTTLDQRKMNEKQESLENHIRKSGMGIVVTDLTGEFTPTNINVAMVPAETLNFIKSNVVERYGVSIPVLAGTATDSEHEAFYQTAIEEFIVQFEQAFTYMLYTDREKDVGHKIRAYYSRLKKLSVTMVTEIATLATNTGLMDLDEIRDMYGLEPLPDGNGKKRIMTLNAIDAEQANTYQVGKGADNNEP